MAAPPPPPPLVKGKLPVVKKPILTPEGESLQNALSGVQRTSKAETKGSDYFADKSPSGFVGLSNQGATCYLNSFLQSLFLSPEFFQLLFAYEPPLDQSEVKKTKNILLQLQRLFANLALSEKKRIGTQDLTRSFGWSDEQSSYSQHDVQELRIVLFKALEKCFSKGGTVAPVSKDKFAISDIFGGTQEMYINCMECGYRSSRLEPFRDIQLMVKDIIGLEESLQLLLQPEEMIGDNQYRCSKCQKLSDALRGTIFVKIPPVLTFQFHRFDFNYATMARVKINSSFSFPMSLNMSKYFESDSEDLYDLYAVMIHSGGANGGHYYAYIKDFVSNRWYVFNDQDVKEIEETQVLSAFGGSIGETNRPSAGGNAYMVVYRNSRMLDENFDPQKPRAGMIHKFLQDEVESLNETYRKEKEEFEWRKSLIHLQFLYPAPGASEKSSKTHMISIPKYKSLREATITVRDALCEEVPEDCIRLRGYDKLTNEKTTAFTGKYEESLDSLGCFSGQILFVETKAPEETFSEVESDTRINISVVKWNPIAKNLENEAKVISIPPNSPVVHLKKKVASIYDIPPSEIRLFTLNTETMAVTEFCNPESPLAHAMTVYCEQGPKDGASLIKEKFESDQYLIDIRYNRIGERLADQNISIDKREPVQLLKERISDSINVPVDNFMLCNNMLAKKQYKDLSLTLEESKIFDGSVVYVCPGEPLCKGEYLLKCYFLPEDYMFVDQSQTTKPQELCVLKVNEASTPDELSALLLSKDGIESARDIIEKIKEKQERKEYCIRWREKRGNRPGKVLLSSGSLLSTFSGTLQDDFELFIQILNSPNDPVDSNEKVLLHAIRWNSSSWSTDKKKFEIVIPTNSCVRDAKEYLSHQCGIPIESVQLVKSPPKIQEVVNNCPISIAVLNWNTPEHISLTKSPWYLKNGDNILFRDSRDPEKEEIDPELRDALLADGIEESIYIRTEYDDQELC